MMLLTNRRKLIEMLKIKSDDVFDAVCFIRIVAQSICLFKSLFIYESNAGTATVYNMSVRLESLPTLVSKTVSGVLPTFDKYYVFSSYSGL